MADKQSHREQFLEDTSGQEHWLAHLAEGNTVEVNHEAGKHKAEVPTNK